MFIGHYAAAFAAKRAAPRLSLGLLVVAASLPDLLFAALVLAGVEVVRPAPGRTLERRAAPGRACVRDGRRRRRLGPGPVGLVGRPAQGHDDR